MEEDISIDYYTLTSNKTLPPIIQQGHLNHLPVIKGIPVLFKKPDRMINTQQVRIQETSQILSIIKVKRQRPTENVGPFYGKETLK